ncbi:MAG: starch synthase, partial [Eubacteriales bacterium]|nr:starch synthase [Eubacteriales bacterium]
MPSLFEPCGLAQMIAMRYGTIPIVRETGGLRDTVEPYNQYTGTGNGFSFRNINAHELLFVTRYACDVKRHMPEAWQALVRTAMSQDFSWDRTAEAYEHLYQDLVRAEPRRPHAPGS